MTEYEEKEVNAIANMLIEQLDRETVDKFIEDENGTKANTIKRSTRRYFLRTLRFRTCVVTL